MSLLLLKISRFTRFTFKRAALQREEEEEDEGLTVSNKPGPQKPQRHYAEGCLSTPVALPSEAGITLKQSQPLFSAGASFIYFSNGSICHCSSRSLQAWFSPPTPPHSLRRGRGGVWERGQPACCLVRSKLAFLTECCDTCTGLIKGPSLRFTFDESNWFKPKMVISFLLCFDAC